METKLLQKAKLIIWDECTMAHRNALHALHKTLEDLCTGQGKFEGVTILLSKDFRQTLPVVPQGTKADELNASHCQLIVETHQGSQVEKKHESGADGQ